MLINERALVLNLMLQQGRITRTEQSRALQLGIRPGLMPEFKIKAQAFTEWVVQTWAPQFVKEGETIRFFARTSKPVIARAVAASIIAFRMSVLLELLVASFPEASW